VQLAEYLPVIFILNSPSVVEKFHKITTYHLLAKSSVYTHINRSLVMLLHKSGTPYLQISASHHQSVRSNVILKHSILLLPFIFCHVPPVT